MKKELLILVDRLLRSVPKALALLVILPTLAWGGAQEFVLYTFRGGTDGSLPGGRLVSDAAGNLFGTTTRGGDFGKGVVFQLTQTAGTWNYSVLYSFRGSPDGDFPQGSLSFDHAGDFYGTTVEGGDHNCGTVYQLSLMPTNRWNETVLYSFKCSTDGAHPQSGVRLDSSGALYGTTFDSGNVAACSSVQGCGTVFKLKPVVNKAWKFIVLHTFRGGNDGGNPQAGVTLDSAGNLYGTTMGFGRYGFGTAYRLSSGPHSVNQSVFRLLHAFALADGVNPGAGLIFDSAGNGYGATMAGGDTECGCGTIFQLTPTPTGRWNFKLLYEFAVDGTGGVQDDLGFDAVGDLYGDGGVEIFELSPGEAGSWNFSVLYEFANAADGVFPQGVTLGANGRFYGATRWGGPGNAGLVFEIAP